MKFISEKKFRLAGLFPLIAACVLLDSCSPGPEGKDQRGSGPPVPVITAEAMQTNMPVEIHAIGNVMAFSQVSVRSQIAGQLKGIHFKEGGEVKREDLLFEIDPRPAQAALDQARANVVRDRAQLENTRVQFQREQKLFEAKVTSQDEFDNARTAMDAAQGTVLADEAAVTNAELSLAYTAIRSPVDGIAGALNVYEGNIVKSIDDVMLTINQIRPISVRFSVPEEQLPSIRRRANEAVLHVEAIVSGETNNPSIGELTFIDNAVDTNTGTILLKATFLNTDNKLWPGQFVQTTLTLSNVVQATTIPSQAVQGSQSGDFVFVVKPDSTVEKRPVTTSVTRDGLVVVASGVKPGETVVTDGQMRLVPGAKISAQKSGNVPAAKPEQGQ